MTDQRFGLVAERYLLRDQLGHGGMGRVWLARDEILDRDVAIKEVAPPTQLSAEEGEHLRVLILREAKAAGRINHPHVVKIYDVIQTEAWPWLVMEYIPSVTLQKAVEYDGPMTPVEVAKVGLAVLEALVAAHEAGVLHRDVKPDNVLLCDDGRVVLSDFGLATLDSDGTTTRTGHLGTPQYVSPERARHGVSSPEADFWSLGATLYAAVEGRSPYGRDSVLETLSALAVDEPDPMRLAGPLTPVISGLLRRNPEERLQPEQVAEMLRQVIAGEQVEEQPRRRPPAPKHHPRAVRSTVLVAFGALALTLTVGFVLSGGGRDGAPLVGPTTTTEPSLTPNAIGLAACEVVPKQTDPVPLGVPGPPGQYALPAGWTWFADPGGFAVGVPEHWTYWRAGTSVCFRDPYGQRIMGVMPGQPQAEALPAYELVTRNEVLLRGPATEWEFTYTLEARKRHAIALVTPGPTVFWIADELDFMPSRPLYYLVKSSFDAVGGP